MANQLPFSSTTMTYFSGVRLRPLLTIRHLTWPSYGITDLRKHVSTSAEFASMLDMCNLDLYERPFTNEEVGVGPKRTGFGEIGHFYIRKNADPHAKCSAFLYRSSGSNRWNVELNSPGFIPRVALPVSFPEETSSLDLLQFINGLLYGVGTSL